MKPGSQLTSPDHANSRLHPGTGFSSLGRREKRRSGTLTVDGTRRRILDAAADILAHNGLAATRMADIAVRADLAARAGIYYYYPSRDTLIEEVMWLGTQQTREHVLAALESLPMSSTPLQRIRAAVEAHLMFVLTIPNYSKAALRNAAHLPKRLRERQAEEERRYGAVWHELLVDASGSGLLRSGLDPFAARMFVLGALNWVPEWLAADDVGVHRLIETAGDFVLGGLTVSYAENSAA